MAQMSLARYAMAPPNQDESEYIILLLTNEELARLSRAAHAMDMKLNDFVVQSAIKQCKEMARV